MKKLLFLMATTAAFLFLIGKILDISMYMIGLFTLVAITSQFMAFQYFRKKWFFRDPIRTPPKEKNAIVSPADGRIMYIKALKGNKVICNKIGQDIEISELTHDNKIKILEGWLIGIYMTPFDIHYTYSPLNGKIENINYTKTGSNLPMVDLWEYINFTIFRRAIDLFSRKFHFINERMSISISGEGISAHVILIADKFVNKIRPFVKKEDDLNISQKLAFIERGSQVDLFIPKKDIDIKVRSGKQVYGGKTIIASY